MPATNNPKASFFGGLIEGVSNGLATRRKEQQAAADRKEQQALAAVKFYANQPGYEDLTNHLMGIALPDVFGEQAQKGRGGKNDPHGPIRNMLGQALKVQQPLTPGPRADQSAQETPDLGADFVGPQQQTPLPSTPFGPPQGSTPQRTVLGVPVLSPQQVAQRTGAADTAKLMSTIQRARAVFPVLKEMDPTTTWDSLLIKMGVVSPDQKQPLEQYTPVIGTIDGKPVTASYAHHLGTFVDPQTHVPLQGFMQRTPGTTSGAKPLTGLAGERVTEALMAMDKDPRAVTPDSPEYMQAIHAASQSIAKDLAEKNQSRDLQQASTQALLSMRQWMNGQGTGSGGGATPPAGSGDGSVLSSLSADEKDEADRIANYKTPLNTRAMNTPRMDKILRAAREINPSFDATNYPMRQRARIAFTTGKQGDNVRALNTALGHLGTLAEKASTLDNADTQLWNKIANAGIEQAGDPRVEGFKTAAEALSSELVNLFRGGVGAEDDVASWRARLSAAHSPAQLAEVLQTAAALVQSRQSALEQQWASAMGDTPMDFLSKDAGKGIAKLDVETRKLRGGSSTAASGPDAARRLRARQALQDKNLHTDDSTIDLFLKNNPTFK